MKTWASSFYFSHIDKRSGSHTVNGFTVVELTIVILVIGILTAISVVAYNGVQQRTKDTERIHNVVEISKAIEMYRADNGKYPAIQDGSGQESSCGSQTDNWGHCDRMKALSDALAPYMSIDPTSLSTAKTGTSYYYYYNSAGSDNYMNYGFLVYLAGSGGKDDGGYNATAYEVGTDPAYCMNKYTGTSASWRYLSNTRCQGGN